MLISHEVPICLLRESKKFNDYDYCLLHLTYEYPEYKQFYIDSIKEGRKVLLDNSLFELGDALTNEQLAQGVIDINPTWYVIPDCLNNKDVTIERFESFIKDYPDLPGIKIGVAQGKTLKDLIECYKYMSEKADKVAVPFDSEAFEEIGEGENKLEKWCTGRRAFFSYLQRHNLISNKPHHLLGCSFAKEFDFYLYREMNIESVDTSNPVVAGIKGLEYGEKGLTEKPSIKLCDLIGFIPSEEEERLIKINTERFRGICNG